MNKRFLATTAMIMIAAAAASGCARIRNVQGYMVDEQLMSSIQPGVDNRDSVMKTLGRPSFAGGFDGREWYYVSRQTRQFAFLQPKAFEQNILIVKFDDQGNVANVERRGLEKVAHINPSGDKTPTLGRETGFFQDLFGNIGRVGNAPTGSPPPPQ